jgi:glycolate oxidase FAD binding subunit
MPTSIDEVVELIRQAAADRAPLEILGHGSKRGLGRPVQAARQLDLSGLTGIVLYEPEELVLTCRAGTPMAEIEAALTARNQQLDFEPADLSGLYGGEAGRGTIGGVLACNLSGPRRIKAGAARDHFLGFKAVSGRGEAFQSGGRVVKNVTGYDLCKLMAGSHGTLAALTEVTVKVLPAPDKSRTVLVYGLDDGTAMTVMSRALNSQHEVSGAAHLPAAIAARSAVDLVAKAGGAVTAIRLEGPGPSVEHRCAELRREFAAHGPGEELHTMRSCLLWREIRDVGSLLPERERPIWRLSVAPAKGAAAVKEIEAAIALPPTLSLPLKGGGDFFPIPPSLAGGGGGRGHAAASFDYFCDWSGGLIWLAPPPAADAGAAAAIRQAVARHGGHATLMRAPDTVRAAIPVFQPQEAALAALSARVKESFDPLRILNPGRMSPSL